MKTRIMAGFFVARMRVPFLRPHARRKPAFCFARVVKGPRAWYNQLEREFSFSVQEGTFFMKHILLIATGGTIASKPTQNGLAPGITSEELVACVPEAAGICRVTAEQIFNLDSTNVHEKHWIAIAEHIRKNYEQYDGFVITHGTDTMAYTAAALSYLIQHSPKPVAITGSQKSIYEQDSDARRNLLDALRYAAFDGAHGVCIVFDGKVIIGTRARKMRTRSFNAFSSIDYPELAVIREGRIIPYIELPGTEAPTFYSALNPRVFVLRLIPGQGGEIFDHLAAHYDAVVVEGFGMGGIPFYEDGEPLAALKRFTESGHTLVMTTQVPHEGSDLGVYSVGVQVKNQVRVIEAHTMTIEAIVTKLMWALAQTKDPEQVRSLFCRPIAKDLL